MINFENIQTAKMVSPDKVALETFNGQTIYVKKSDFDRSLEISDIDKKSLGYDG